MYYYRTTWIWRFIEAKAIMTLTFLDLVNTGGPASLNTNQVRERTLSRGAAYADGLSEIKLQLWVEFMGSR